MASARDLNGQTMTWAVCLGIVLGLTAWKAFLLRPPTRRFMAAVFFAAAVSLCVTPVHRLISVWNDPSASRMVPLIGDPIAVLGVPVVSFLVDLRDPEATFFRLRPVRVIFEVFVAIPLWMCVVNWIEFFVLGWVWI